MAISTTTPESAALPGPRWDLQLGGYLVELERRRGLVLSALLLAPAVELVSYLLNARITVEYHSWSRLFWPSEDPFGAIPQGLGEHRHRVLAPLIAYGLHLRGLSAALVPMLANLLVHAVGYVWLRRQEVRAEYALAVVVLVSTTLVIAANRMVVGFQDSLAALGLLFALNLRNPFAVAGVVGVFMFADERIVMATPLLIFWHAFVDRQSERVWRDVLVRSAVIGCVAGVALWLMHLIRVHTGVAAEAAEHMRRTLELEMLAWNCNAILVGYFMALRGAWLLPAAAFLSLLRTSPREAVLFGWALLATLPVAALVGDISRVAAFCAVPAVYIGAVLIARSPRWDLRTTLVQALIVNLLCPCLHMVGDEFFTGYPLPLQLLRNYVQTGRVQLVVFRDDMPANFD